MNYAQSSYGDKVDPNNSMNRLVNNLNPPDKRMISSSKICYRPLWSRITKIPNIINNFRIIIRHHKFNNFNSSMRNKKSIHFGLDL
jgi:hypothetical protein